MTIDDGNNNLNTTKNCVIPPSMGDFQVGTPYISPYNPPQPWQDYGVGTTGISLYQHAIAPYTRWTMSPEGTHMQFQIELPGVVADDDFVVLLERDSLVCKSKRFDARMTSTDRITLPSSVDLSEYEATFKACVLTVRFPFRHPGGQQKLDVKVI